MVSRVKVVGVFLLSANDFPKFMSFNNKFALKPFCTHKTISNICLMVSMWIIQLTLRISWISHLIIVIAGTLFRGSGYGIVDLGSPTPSRTCVDNWSQNVWFYTQTAKKRKCLLSYNYRFWTKTKRKFRAPNILEDDILFSSIYINMGSKYLNHYLVLGAKTIQACKNKYTYVWNI